MRDGGDILAQNVNADGTLGPRWQDLGGGTSGAGGAPQPASASSATITM